jgi:hypothetical protein
VLEHAHELERGRRLHVAADDAGRGTADQRRRQGEEDLVEAVAGQHHLVEAWAALAQDPRQAEARRGWSRSWPRRAGSATTWTSATVLDRRESVGVRGTRRARSVARSGSPKTSSSGSSRPDAVTIASRGAGRSPRAARSARARVGRSGARSLRRGPSRRRRARRRWRRAAATGRAGRRSAEPARQPVHRDGAVRGGDQAQRDVPGRPGAGSSSSSPGVQLLERELGGVGEQPPQGHVRNSRIVAAIAPGPPARTSGRRGAAPSPG